MHNKAVAAFVMLFAATAVAQAQAPARPVMPQVCTNCHQPQNGNIRGYMENVAFKSNSLQVKIDNITEIVKFDAKMLKVVDGDKTGIDILKENVRNREVRIEYSEKDGTKTATLLSFKGPIKVAPEKLIGFAEIRKLVALGPEKGGYTLIDSRPLPRFQEGAIPTAINLPYPAFDKFIDRLPKDKDKLLIFYCSGVTCMMSPSSMRRAEAMGYKNVKVYREGMPEWTQKEYGVLSAQFLKEAWIDNDLAHVLIDVRPAGAAKTGYIKGAVSLPASQVKAALPEFPDKKFKAPFIVYDESGGQTAVDAAKAIVAAGNPNVSIVSGGLKAWQAAGYPLAGGDPATKVTYVPKPRPGAVSIDEFIRLAQNTPADTLILDVRNQDEANSGMIKGAKLIPDEDVLARLNEIPKDKRIIAHCASGVRAEMTYHKLKEKGYNVSFLNAGIEIAKSGQFKVTPP